MPPSSARAGSGSKAAAVAPWINSSLSRKARKIVPSATPAASAIWRVVTFSPYWHSNGTVAAISAARRSSGAIGRARPAGLVDREPSMGPSITE
jgi:hypothetical protein